MRQWLNLFNPPKIFHIEFRYKIIQPLSDKPPASVVVLAAVIAISSKTSLTSSPVKAEHSAYRSQRIVWAMAYAYINLTRINQTPLRNKIKSITNSKNYHSQPPKRVPPTYLLRINDSLLLNPQIPLQPQQHNRYIVPLPHVQPRCILPPDLLRVDQTAPVVNGIAYNDKIRIQQCVILRGRRVVEFKSVLLLPPPAGCAHMVDEWLVEIAEERERGVVGTGGCLANGVGAGGGRRVGVGASTTDASKGSFIRKSRG